MGGTAGFITRVSWNVVCFNEKRWNVFKVDVLGSDRLTSALNTLISSAASVHIQIFIQTMMLQAVRKLSDVI